MARYLFTLYILVISFAASAQPAIGMQYSSKGYGLTVGYLNNNKIEITAGYNVSVLVHNVPDIYYSTIGYKIELSDYEKDNFSLTPSAGYGIYSLRSYDEKNYFVAKNKSNKPFYGMELGKDWYMGRLSLHVNYCGMLYYGVGIKAYIK